ncbi:hypothetical protein ACLOJK_002293 [Asimina triloba]
MTNSPVGFVQICEIWCKICILYRAVSMSWAYAMSGTSARPSAEYGPEPDSAGGPAAVLKSQQ